ncbi:MAG: hypothetical protein Q4A55_04910 [Aerococcus sp.]|nr:hypothetical protein [Aerococcus sp.]
MRIDELYAKLNTFQFIENYYVAIKHYGDDEEETAMRVLKLYSEAGKIAEVNLDTPYMLRTTYSPFGERTLLERQALLKVLVEFANTPIEQRHSEVYFAYFNDLHHLPHFIKRMSNNRLTDEMIPMAYLNTLSEEQLQSYLFTTSEMESFPKDYQPRFTPDSFVKVKTFDEMIHELDDRFND